MAFHLGFELPLRTQRSARSGSVSGGLDPGTAKLTWVEAEIIKKQIRKNTEVIDAYIGRLDLFVNREKYPHRELFVQKIRERMFLLMEENDTFRSLLWRHLQGEVALTPIPAAE